MHWETIIKSFFAVVIACCVLFYPEQVAQEVRKTTGILHQSVDYSLEWMQGAYMYFLRQDSPSITIMQVARLLGSEYNSEELPEELCPLAHPELRDISWAIRVVLLMTILVPLVWIMFIAILFWVRIDMWEP